MTNWPLLLSIAQKHLLSRVKQSSVAAMGVTFGIATFIILIGFMTGLNGMLDGLILNRTPHIHIYNDIKPSEKQPIDYYSELKNSLNIVHSVKPKQSQGNGLHSTKEHTAEDDLLTHGAAQCFHHAENLRG